MLSHIPMNQIKPFPLDLEITHGNWQAVHTLWLEERWESHCCSNTDHSSIPDPDTC